MNNYSSDIHADALAELDSISQIDDPASRLFFICCHLAWDWAIRQPASWLSYDGAGIAHWDGPTSQQQKFYKHLLIVANDFDAVTSIVYRLDWLLKHYRVRKDFLSNDDLAIFLQADVHSFHVEFRSLLDSLCHVINVTSASPGKIPTGSFKDLRNWCVNNTDRSTDLIGQELTELISSSLWFIDVRDLRDKIVHFQQNASVFIVDPPGEIVFTLMQHAGREFAYEGPLEFLYGGRVYFLPHAGYYLGRLIYLLNTVCKLAALRLDISLVDVHWGTTRFPAMRNAISSAQLALNSGFPVSEEIRSRIRLPSHD